MLTIGLGIGCSGSKMAFRVAAPSGHRHWRVYSSKSVANGSYHGLAQIEFRAVAGGPDLTVAAEADTRATALTYHGVFPPSRAFNDDESNDFLSNGGEGQNPNWIAWDFGEGNEQDIVEVTIHPPGNLQSAPNDVLIEFSDDGVNWYTAWDEGVQSWDGSTKTFTKP